PPGARGGSRPPRSRSRRRMRERRRRLRSLLLKSPLPPPEASPRRRNRPLPRNSPEAARPEPSISLYARHVPEKAEGPGGEEKPRSADGARAVGDRGVLDPVRGSAGADGAA